MLTHALIAVDFSPATDPMLECLPELAQFGVREVTLVYALDIGYPRGPETEHLQHYQSRLDEKKAFFEEHGFTANAEIRVGYPASEILEAANERQAELVVIGSHGHGAIGGALLGSAASEITHRSALPVLVVRLIAAEEEGEKIYKRACPALTTHVLYATDFSENSEKAFRYAKEIASGAGRITLLHVQDKSKIKEGQLEEFNRIDQERLERLKEELKSEGAKDASIVLLYGSPSGEILHWAEENNVSLIVMGSHGRGFIGEVLLGSVSHDMLRKSRSPVLVIPRQR